ncbi:MAG: aldose 1-epimerase family protein [Succinivibrionaceae bacterium]|nr:aldose 1-epimerase family protein [Succinivibrionaceae bacterium]
MEYHIVGGRLALTVSSHGAEPVSLVDLKSGRELLWGGDPAFWGRHAPHLFPLVGKLRHGEYRHQGRAYRMGQHGFARDLGFSLAAEGPGTLAMALSDSEATRACYPFAFSLEVSFAVEGNLLRVSYLVENPGREDLPFSLGAHPAFNCPPGPGRREDCRLRLLREGRPLGALEAHYLNGEGVGAATERLALEEGCLTPSEAVFARDALILEGAQADRVELLGPGGSPWLEVRFSCPVLGLWTPPGKGAPFVCVEPWWGRADGESFAGELREREYGQILPPGGRFACGYEVVVP